MATMQGMDVQQVRDLAVQLDNAAQSLHQIGQSIDRAALSEPLAWRGGDADRFRQGWSGRDRSLLRRCSEELRLAARAARANAEEQEQASQASTGAVFSGTAHASTVSTASAPAERIPKQDGMRGFSSGREGKYGRDRDLLDVCEAGYKYGEERADFAPGGWSPVSADELRELGLDPESFDQGNFSAALFKDPQGNLVLSYQGTNPSDLRDWHDNAESGLAISDADKYAVSLAHQVDVAARAKGLEVQFTGHSAGGRMAISAALATGQPAVTFNTAPMSTTQTEWASNNHSNHMPAIRNYVTDNDVLEPLRSGMNYRPPGEVITLQPVYRPGDAFHGHGPEALSDGMAARAVAEEEWY